MDTTQKDQPTFGNQNYILFEWKSSSRPFKRITPEQTRTVATILVLIVAVLFFLSEYFLIVVACAVAFVGYMLFSVPPDSITNKITSLGIQTGDHFHKWEEMGEFWFDDRLGSKLLVVSLTMGFPTHLYLVIQPEHIQTIGLLLTEHLPMKDKPERSFLDSAATWLQKNMPLERKSSPNQVPPQKV